ncbi:hypothetical protein MAR_005604 [Mya arenaria]|uniref:Glycosyltransferase n=1 Tax=Mya arenaria TaxID=6604 RepID=A0ABY7F3Y0_MYAAR|nr:uncharacterized protein LOC128203014 [Mya arenaria]XP_052760216.1 uncharacterized protein LOC128203014 [Mya arenaria]WAR15499.1 hypothetical protein MAR_005604 [Mya arenaria]
MIKVNKKTRMKKNFRTLVNICLVVFVVSLIVGYTKWNMIPVNSSSSPSPITKYDLRILVIVYNRAQSMLRLLNSINEANFDGDNVKLEVWIDRSKAGVVDTLTVKTAEEFVFKHGHYEVLKHSQHVGIYGQWFATWKARVNSSEIAVILEDDLIVSPHFYKYLKLVHNKYDNVPEINGFSLQGISIKHAIGYSSQTLEAPESCLVYLYPVLGTWGFSPSRDNWIHFLEWFSQVIQNKTFQPYVPGNVVTAWYKIFQAQGRADGEQSIYHIYHSWKFKEYTLYPNFKGHKGLTTNWLEAGLHYSGNASKPSNELLKEWKSDYEHLPDQPKHLNLKGVVQD